MDTKKILAGICAVIVGVVLLYVLVSWFMGNFSMNNYISDGFLIFFTGLFAVIIVIIFLPAVYYLVSDLLRGK